jgi:clan AA aspartic protease (TIGR02281 family)
MQKNIQRLLPIMALTVLSLGASGGDTIYKCKNPHGDLLYQKSPCREDVQTVTSWMPKAAKVQAPAPEPEKKDKHEFVIKQHSNGSYLMEGSVNGKPLTFVVDTGASFVSIPGAMAREAGISCQDDLAMQTANGSTTVCSGTIKKLNFGPFFTKDVIAVIAPNLHQPLLGMNVLQQLKIAQEKGEMRLSLR